MVARHVCLAIPSKTKYVLLTTLTAKSLELMAATSAELVIHSFKIDVLSPLLTASITHIQVNASTVFLTMSWIDTNNASLEFQAATMKVESALSATLLSFMTVRPRLAI